MYNNSNYIILSLVFNKSHLGIAYYNWYDSTLHILEDMFEEKNTFNIVNCLCKQIMPHKIITITGQPVKLYCHLTRITQTLQTNIYNSSKNNLIILPRSEYSYFNCFNRVRSLEIVEEPNIADCAERIIFVNSFLNFTSYSIINALGLLLLYIDKNWNAIFVSQIVPIRYSSLKYFTITDYVSINEESFKALNIMQSKWNCCSIDNNKNTNFCNKKDLFSLFNYCQTRLGEQFLRKLFKQPTRNITVLNERFDFIKYCMNPTNIHIVCNFKNLLSEIYNIPNTFLNLQETHILREKSKEWKLLYKILRIVIQISELCVTEINGPIIFKKITNYVTDKINFIKFLIEYVFNFESSENKIFSVKYGIDNVLDKLRSIYSYLPEVLSSISSHNLRSLPTEIENYHLVYVPEIGYIVAVTKWRILVSSYRNIPNIEYKFSANGVNYYKCSLTKELDETFGDISRKIRCRSSRIMLKLVNYIHYYSEAISDAIQICAELDALLALYLVAYNQHYVRPQMVKEHKIFISGGRHPLIEQTTTYIPNDILSEKHENILKIITGPNNCGKSTFVKQTALIVFMAHIGSYVPANVAIIGLISEIFTKITTCESISLESSSFLQDIRQVSRALSSTNKEALVIIDEFGKGTSEIDATALLSAIIIEFLNKGEECPHILLVTHFYKVLEWIPENKIIGLQSFEFFIDKNQILFLYRIVKGRITSNYSLAVAQITYLEDYILNYAKEIFKSVRIGQAPLRPIHFNRKELSLESIYLLFSSETILILTDLQKFLINIMGDKNISMLNDF